MSPILYHTSGCPYAEVAAQVASRLGVPLERNELSQRELASLPWGNYERSPVLVDGPRVLEDWRAIVRYVDEIYGGGALTKLAPAARAKLFELCEEVDKKILSPLALLSGARRDGRLRQLLKLMIPKKLHASAAEVPLSSLQETLVALRSRPEFNQTDLPLLNCLLTAAENALDCTPASRDIEISR